MIRVLFLAMTVLFASGLMDRASAVEPVRVAPDALALDLTSIVQHHKAESDLIQISTAPGSDGIVRRVAVRAREGGTRPDWIVFALTNDTDEQLERLLVAPHYRLGGSGMIWPDLGSPRIAAITASQGIRPERQEAIDADIFNITLDPGATVTFIAELRTPGLPQLSLWEPDAYKAKTNGLTLYKGIIIGIAGLLALFLTVVFVVKGAVIFPAAAALAWAVLAYACIDFGFFQQLFPIAPSTNRVYRAAAEAVLAATLLVFLFAYLNLSRWHVRYSHFTAAWLVFLGALVGLAAFDASVAAGVARISIATVAGIGFILIVHLATHGYDRAVMLIPTWFLLLVWVTAAGLTINGQLTRDLVPPALMGGLVLIVLLIGFTVVQHAFAGGALAQGLVSDTERRALALAGSGDVVFDWDVSADRLHVGDEIESQLLLGRGALDGSIGNWLGVMHPYDRDRFRATLDTVLEQRRGRLSLDFRLRASDGQYFWFNLRARPVVGADGEVIRVVGVLADVTDARNTEERLLFDAVHDSLTGLPNRQLLQDRLDSALLFAAQNPAMRPTVIYVDLDGFREVVDAVGPTVSDSIMLTLSRRLGRLLRPQDTIARFGGDEWGLILMSESAPERIIAFADMVRRAISTPVSFGDREVFLKASVGIALYDAQSSSAEGGMLKNAQIAMLHAKQQGGDRIEVFRPGMSAQRLARLALEEDMRRAIDKGEIRLSFQPIVSLDDRTIAGFDVRPYWAHPRLGHIDAEEFVPLAEDIGVITEIGQHVLERTARELAAWQMALEVEPPIFATLTLFSSELLRPELIADVKRVMSANAVRPQSLKLGFRETMLTENPEFAAQMLIRLRQLGAGLVLDGFGTGYFALSQMRYLPFDTLRVDRVFVRDLGDGSRPGMLRSIVTLAQDLEMDIVADGVENEAGAVLLAGLGCRYGQGFAFGNVMSSQDARRFLGATSAAA